MRTIQITIDCKKSVCGHCDKRSKVNQTKCTCFMDKSGKYYANLYMDKNGSFRRCKQCLDAEVKEVNNEKL